MRGGGAALLDRRAQARRARFDARDVGGERSAARLQLLHKRGGGDRLAAQLGDLPPELLAFAGQNLIAAADSANLPLDRLQPLPRRLLLAHRRNGGGEEDRDERADAKTFRRSSHRF